MRSRPEDSIVVRLALVASLVSAAVSLTVAIHRLDANHEPAPIPLASGAASDAELIRCRDFGTAAAEDESCLAAWSEEQRRFFGTSETTEPAPSALPPSDGAAEEAADDLAGGLEAP